MNRSTHMQFTDSFFFALYTYRRYVLFSINQSFNDKKLFLFFSNDISFMYITGHVEDNYIIYQILILNVILMLQT